MIAVVTVALGLRQVGDVESAQTRLVSGTTWEIVELLLTGAAFAFVGLVIRNVAGSLSGPLDVAIWQALAVTARSSSSSGSRGSSRWRRSTNGCGDARALKANRLAGGR